MRATLLTLLCGTLGVAVGHANSLKLNFQASFTTYDRPATAPEVAYAMPNGGNFYFPTAAEVADDVKLDDSEQVIAGIRFEYYANYAQTGGLIFRMYEPNRQGEPGTLIYTRTIDVLLKGAVVDINFSYDQDNVLPDEFFFSLQFPDVTETRKAGAILSDSKPQAGDTEDKLWISQKGAWEKLELTDRPTKVQVKKEGKKLHFTLKEDRRKRVRVESSDQLEVGWTEMGEAETDDNGDGTFSADEDEGVAHRFYRTVAP